MRLVVKNMNFGNMERVSSTILRPAHNLKIKNVVTFGTRNYGNGKREDAIKVKGYKSNKYSDVDYVSDLSIETNDYLVFEANAPDDFKKRSEVFISYPHITNVKNSFTKMLSLAEGKSKKKDGTKKIVFKETKDGQPYITEEYQDFIIKIDGMINNKSMILMFDIIEKSDIDNSILYSRAISIFFNDEEIYATVDIENFSGIVSFLNDFNLLLSSQNLMVMSYQYQMARALDLSAKTSRGSGGKPVSNRRKLASKSTQSTNIKSSLLDDDEEEDDEEFVKSTKKVKKKKDKGELNAIDTSTDAEEIPFY